ncbi:hypothetical protein BDV23DRAFT_159052 [Aspergillus alliaceus]|uniref:Uncharacterized protein n=1 Tax=Petromyces alliaceus TaxID=209559 RepID=A0A5N7C2X2_PETAA|nr:hypothetical protein BDV23DRAFT_159052 [Aspergillus alliaceus]
MCPVDVRSGFPTLIVARSGSSTETPIQVVLLPFAFFLFLFLFFFCLHSPRPVFVLSAIVH